MFEHTVNPEGRVGSEHTPRGRSWVRTVSLTLSRMDDTADDLRRPPAPSHSYSQSGSSPVDRAGFLSFSTMSWMTPLMWSMSRKHLDISSLSLSPLDRADTNGDTLRALWEQEVSSVGLQKASLTRVLLRFQRDRLLLVLCVSVLFMLCLFVGSGVLVHEILRYIVHSSSVLVGVVLSLALVLVELSRVGCLTLCFAVNLRTGIRLRTGFCMLGFNKILSLRAHRGQIVDVLTGDSLRLFDAVLLCPLVLPFPLLFVFCSVYSVYILGYTALIGFYIVLLFIILQCVFGTLISRLQKKSLIVTHSRVQTVNELLSFIKFIKMFVWEMPFTDRITDLRRSEVNVLQRSALIQNLSVTISPLVPIMAAVFTFIVHTSLGLPLTTHTAYPIVTIFNCMRFILSMTPSAIKLLAEAAVSVARLKKLLLIENPEPYISRKTDCRSAVVMEKAVLSWNKPVQHPDTEDGPDSMSNCRHTEVTPTLNNISFTLNKGRLLGVCGSVGSGKTSLICSLLEQMYLLQGSVSVEGSIAYTSQQAWIFYGTVQDNILMGNPLDPSRYNRVLSSCSLQANLDILPHGDQTLLGDQGLNLPAGQRQQVSLARAIYSNKDLYLLDDPLSTVDTHTGKHIFEECIKKELHGKTVILVTNQVQYMEFCDEVLVMNDGTIVEAGSHLDLMRVQGLYAELVNKHLTERSVPWIEEKKKVDGQMNGGTVSPAFNMSDENTDAPSSDCKPADQLIDEEGSKKNSVTQRTFTTFGQYCNAGGGFCVSLFLLLVFIVLITNTVLSYSWLSYWLQQGHGTANVTSSERGNVSLNADLPFYQLMFGVSVVFLLMVCIIKCFCYVKVTLHASTTLHNSLLNKIIACPMSFFESTPTGRILNCFSRYQEEIDSLVPHHLNILLTFFLIVVSICVINSIIFPIMLLPIFILVTVFTLLMRTFLRNIIELKQTESISRTQYISLWTSINQGLSTVHAYDKTHHYTQLFKTLFDINANHFLLFNSAMRWLCFLVDSLCAAMTLPVALLVVFTSNDVCSPPMKALALSYIIQLRTNSQYLIQSLMEVQARFISVERLLEYIMGCESEGSGKLQVDRVLEDWPQLGAITFLDYRMRYREDSPDVLNGLQLHVRAGEKLGIVGRAGSGKSSLALALSRLVEPTAGSILIDGVDIKTISLLDLRTKLSIIPQDPVLFTGTVRYNLDPLNRYSDEEVWAALEKTYMKDIICSLDRRLNTELTDGGRGTFSVGQKQLMCLSRALLRDCKIVLLDEVTASVDAEMNAQIQIIIREAFKSCTVLTITHHLNTVLQADRVLVLDHGQVVEFDHPDVLKQKPDSLFSSLLTAATL